MFRIHKELLLDEGHDALQVGVEGVGGDLGLIILLPMDGDGDLDHLVCLVRDIDVRNHHHVQE